MNYISVQSHSVLYYSHCVIPHIVIPYSWYATHTLLCTTASDVCVTYSPLCIWWKLESKRLVLGCTYLITLLWMICFDCQIAENIKQKNIQPFITSLSNPHH